MRRASPELGGGGEAPDPASASSDTSDITLRIANQANTPRQRGPVRTGNMGSPQAMARARAVLLARWSESI